MKEKSAKKEEAASDSETVSDAESDSGSDAGSPTQAQTDTGPHTPAQTAAELEEELLTKPPKGNASKLLVLRARLKRLLAKVQQDPKVNPQQKVASLSTSKLDLCSFLGSFL